MYDTSMTKINFTDRASIGSVRKTVDGYLVAHSRALRTGIQEYLPSELGLVGDGVVRVNRSEESVFSKDSLKSLAQAPVTVGHPAEMITADNWKDYAVGELGSDIMRDGEWIVVSPMVKDAAAVAAVEAGTAQLSAGYVAEMNPAPEGADYEFEMGPPIYNHLAIVDEARAGKEARIGEKLRQRLKTPQRRLKN